MSRFTAPLALIVVCSSFIAGARAAEPARRPNVVILYADDMGYGDLGVQNPESKIPTPNLDRLAAEGMRFTDAHSSSGICTPSRYALLHGRYHWRRLHGIVNSFDQPVLDAERTTLAEMFRAKGYRTACIGKWHLGWDWNSVKKPGTPKPGKEGYSPDAFDWTRPIAGGPLSHGFDTYFGDDVPNFPPYAWFENDKLAALPTTSLTKLLAAGIKTAEGQWEARPGPAVADWDFTAVMPTLTKRAVAWIGQQKKDEPFFLYFPFTSPHAPIVPTTDFAGKSQAGGYGDFMTQTDATVGEVLRALERHGFADDTLVVFSADNGPEHYAYERVRNFGHRSMGPLRGLKRDLWEGGHRVPLVIRWPGIVKSNRTSDALFGQIDLFATLAAIVDFKIPAGSAEDSLNQLPLLEGSGLGARTELVHNTNAGRYALRSGKWLLVDGPTGGVSKVPAWYDEQRGYPSNDSPGELYDLSADLAQKHNLYASQPEKVAELKRKLAAYTAGSIEQRDNAGRND